MPRRLTYQGTLSENGSALTGHVSARFALYPDSVSSRILWQETVPIEVSGGTFTAELGAAAPLPDSLFAQPTLFLGIRIDADDEMRPRHRVTSVAYALRSAQAENVDDRAITPRSLTLKSGRASFGASGNIVGSTASVDSLVVGGTPVVGSGGRWVGPPVPALPAGLKLDTLIVRQTADTLLFLPIGTWQRIDTFSAAFRLGTVSTVEIVFAGALTANGSLETRVALRSLDPLGKASAVTNLSGILPPASGELRSSAFSNLGARTLDPGTYEVYAEERLQSSQAGRMHTGTLLIRLYRR